MKRIKICVLGAGGGFAQCFIPLYQAHPLVEEVLLCEAIPERLSAASKQWGIARTFRDYDDALRSDVNAVAIFTQRWTHAPLALQALAAGKHVYSAVPAATTLEQLAQLVDAVKRTGLTYMMGETSMYYGPRLFCKEKWDAGAFGRFVYGEGEYLHDMSHGFYEAYQHSGGEAWKSTASYPPMLYPTHSVSMVLSVTGARATEVSCIGVLDDSDDGVFREDVSLWKNRFSNQSALFRTSDGGAMRINEFRRVGVSAQMRSVRVSLFGTLGSFEEQAESNVWMTRHDKPVDVTPHLKCVDLRGRQDWERNREQDGELMQKDPDFVSSFAEIHQKYRARLPAEYRTQRNGHEGSHQFLTDDFVTAVVQTQTPSVSIWDAARYNAPGIVAHESSKRDGELLPIPDFPGGILKYCQ